MMGDDEDLELIQGMQEAIDSVLDVVPAERRPVYAKIRAGLDELRDEISGVQAVTNDALNSDDDTSSGSVIRTYTEGELHE